MNARNQKGMTLVEVMIAMGVGLVLLLGLLQMMDFTRRSTKSTGLSLDWTSTTNAVLTTLNSEEACKNALSGPKFVSGNAIELNTFTSGTGILLKKNEVMNGIKITRMIVQRAAPATEFTGVDPVENSMIYPATFTLEAEKSITGEAGQVAMGGNQLPKKVLPFNVVVDKATEKNIISCFTAYSPRYLASAAAQGCNTAGGIWDSAAQKCDIRKVVCDTMGGTYVAGAYVAGATVPCTLTAPAAPATGGSNPPPSSGGETGTTCGGMPCTSHTTGAPSGAYN